MLWLWFPWTVKGLVDTGQRLILPLTQGTVTERLVSRSPSIHSASEDPGGTKDGSLPYSQPCPFSVSWTMWGSQPYYKNPQAFLVGPLASCAGLGLWPTRSCPFSQLSPLPEPGCQHWSPPGATPQPRGPVLAGLLCCGLLSCLKPLFLWGFTPVFLHSAQRINICEATLLSSCQIWLSYLLMLSLVLLNHL